MADPLTDLEQRLATYSEQLDTKQQASAAELEALTKTKDRSLIAKLVVGLFCLASLLALIFLWWGAGRENLPWDVAAEKLIQLLSSIILPVVTLVIGYYFGTEKALNDDAGNAGDQV